MTWRERGIHAALTLALPAEVQTQLEGELLSDAAQEAGCTRHSLSFHLCERAVVVAGPELAEQLRARGWGVVLRGDPRCPLPFGTRARALYTELVLEAPETPDPFLALEDGDRSPLGRRMLAAKAAGLTITAETVRTAAQAKVLAIAGFDRGGGPFAEAGLR
jgi:EAL domain-containing protein (putative c-di-GMP-specific phosphodiesterase class I)